MFVFTVQDPGPWQSFVLRPDNIGLPIQVMTNKYLTEQLMFAEQYNTFIAYQNWINSQNAGDVLTSTETELVTENGQALVTENGTYLILT
jgi:hypothetical protein